MLRRAFLLLCVLLAAAPPSALAAGDTSTSPIVFNGVLVQGSVTKVSLYNPSTGETKWVQVGKSYGGYTVGYEPALPATKQTPATKDTVLLTLGGKVQRIQLQDATTTSVVSSVPGKISAISIAADKLQSLERSLAEGRNDPNTDPQLLQKLQEARNEQFQVVTTLVATTQLASLEGSLDEARNASSTNPELIQAFEDVRHDLQQRLTTGTAYETPRDYGSTSEIEYPNSAQARIDYNPDGTLRSVWIQTPDANGMLKASNLYTASDPESQAIILKIKEAEKAFAESAKK
jgi:hypothetical protein